MRDFLGAMVALYPISTALDRCGRGGEPLHLTPSDPILPPFSGIFFTISRSERRRRLRLTAVRVRLGRTPLGQFLSFKVSTVDMKIVLSQSVGGVGRSLGPWVCLRLHCSPIAQGAQKIKYFENTSNSKEIVSQAPNNYCNCPQPILK